MRATPLLVALLVLTPLAAATHFHGIPHHAKWGHCDEPDPIFYDRIVKDGCVTSGKVEKGFVMFVNISAYDQGVVDVEIRNDHGETMRFYCHQTRYGPPPRGPTCEEPYYVNTPDGKLGAGYFTWTARPVLWDFGGEYAYFNFSVAYW